MSGASAWLGSIGTDVIWQAIAAGFALIVATLHAALALSGRRPSAPRMVAGAAFGVAATAGLGQAALLADDPRLAAVTAGVVALLGPLLVGPAVAVTLSACAFTGARGHTRRWGLAALAGVPVLIGAAAVAWGGLTAGDPVYATGRAGVYVLLALLAGGSVLTPAEEEGPGPAAGVAGAAMAPLATALGEASQRGLVALLIVLQAEAVPAERWPLAVERMLAHVSPEWTASWVALACASVPPAVAVVAMRSGSGRLAAVGVAIVAIALGAVLLRGADLAPALLALRP